jgi:hypothetical protein
LPLVFHYLSLLIGKVNIFALPPCCCYYAIYWNLIRQNLLIFPGAVQVEYSRVLK